MCSHATPCPSADSDARDLAAVLSSHPEQGWRLLCNGVVLFDDDGELQPCFRLATASAFDDSPSS